MRKIRLLALLLSGMTAAAPAAAGLIEDVDLEAGIEIGHFHYREPSVMSQKGLQYGVYGSIAILAARPWEFELFMSLVGGDVEYDGAYMSGIPLKGDTGNAIFNFRALAGYEVTTGPVRLKPYSGLGYRYLVNDLDDLPGGYRRQQIYLYLPLGVDVSLPLGYGGSWTIGLKSEFDWMFAGFHKTDRGINREFDGQSGWGFRLTPYARWNVSEKVALKLEVFGEYWKIGDSNMDRGFLEPENSSTYSGARFGVCF